MSSSGSGTSGRRAVLLLLMALPAAAAAQEDASGAGAITAEEALATARATYSALREEQVTACPSDGAQPGEAGAEGNVIIVCRERVDGARYRLEQPAARPVGAAIRDTASGAPRAPDFNPSCLHTRGRANCLMVGAVAPRALMIDLAALPEPLSAEEAAAVLRAPEEATGSPGGVMGEPAPTP